VNLYRVVDEVDDPVVRDTRTRVQVRLVLAIDPVRRLRDLDDQYTSPL